MKTIKVTGWDDVPKDFTGRVLMLGLTSWLQNGITHRLDGPALKRTNGEKYWYILDQELTEQEFGIFQYMWRSTSKKKTKKLMKIFVKLARVK